MNIIDTHTHLHFENFNDDLPQVLSAAANSGVSRMLTIGTDVESSIASLKLAQKYNNYLYAAAGLHPTDCATATDVDFEKIESLIKNNTEFIAVGEVGLDLYWKKVSLNQQLFVFEAMQNISESANLPMIIHNRGASLEMKEYFLKRELKLNNPGVLHSFAGTIEDAKFYLDLGFYFSFTGVVTFKNFKEQEVVKYIPVDRLLLETDSPFLAPVPFRGKRNEPSYLIFSLNKIAELKNLNPEDLAEQTFKNTIKLFNLHL